MVTYSTLNGSTLGRHRRPADALDIEDQGNGFDRRTRAECDPGNAHRSCPQHSPAGYAALASRHSDPVALVDDLSDVDIALEDVHLDLRRRAAVTHALEVNPS